MNIYKEEDMCTGCSACVNICPKSCITMVENSQGFLIPHIDESICINCGLCQKHCHTHLEKSISQKIPEVYSYINSDKNVLLSSSSGGAFYQIALSVIEKGGYVCAAVYDDDWSVKHIISNKIEDLSRMQGSKYLQSRLEFCFSQIKEKLIKDIPVLFVGTPCQVLGLKEFLSKDYANLFLVDVICHSVPSPKIFKDYLKMLERDVGKIKSINLRDKTNGWSEYSLNIKGDRKNLLLPHRGNYYMDGFLDGLYHRSSCNNCPVKLKTGYMSDITLGDFWGYFDTHSDIGDADFKNGISVICLNTDKGKKIISQMSLNKELFQDFINKNPKYCECSIISTKYEMFWKIYNKKGLYKAYSYVYRKSLIIRFKTFLKKYL